LAGRSNNAFRQDMGSRHGIKTWDFDAGSPEVGAEILDRVGTYGRQLGQITDAMIVLLRHLPHRANLAPEQREAIVAFEKMANDIANIKEKHKLQAVRS
jgi:hypothetical protein